MPGRLFLLNLSFCLLAVTIFGQNPADTLKLPQETEKPLQQMETYELNMEIKGEEQFLLFRSAVGDARTPIEINQQPDTLTFKNDEARYKIETDFRGKLFLIRSGNEFRLHHASVKSNGSERLRTIPLWMSILPPLVAIVLALIFREVIIALFAGIWTGAFIAGGLRIDSIYYLFLSFFQVVEKYIVNALNDGGHLAVIVFSLLIGGMVAIISRNGGMAGVINALSRFATTPKSAQFITWLLGVAIFFDDYANTLIVGNTMRSVTDRFKISREKLAYIVDSTAAPVAAVAFITTWIGAELGYIEDGIKLLSGFDQSLSTYSIFLQSLKYSFYPALTLLFILMLIYTGREYGPMLKAEKRARFEGQVSPAVSLDDDEPNMEDLSPVGGAPKIWWHAAVPVLTVIGMTIFGLLDTGMASTYGELVDAGVNMASSTWSATWSAIPALFEGETVSFFTKLGKLIGNSDSYVALLWASISGVVIAIIITLGARIMRTIDTMFTLVTGLKTMMPAVIILVLAWSLAITTSELHTATYLTGLLSGNISPYLMPSIIFVLSATIAFSTGSSWSTMAILYPISIPTTWAVCQAVGLSPEISQEILLNVIAVVLAASVLGDHCSPISDTTILSSLASDCNHIDHVRTQLPYALTVGLVSIVAGAVASYLGGGWLLCAIIFLTSIGVLYLLILQFGKKVEEGA